MKRLILCILLLMLSSCKEESPPQVEVLEVPQIRYVALPIDMYILHFFKKTEYSEVADIITAKAILESGWFKNRNHVVNNNYFSMKDAEKMNRCSRSDSCLKRFRSLDENLTYMLEFYKRRGYRMTRSEFLKDIQRKGYAEDPGYISKLKKIAKRYEDS